jgi:tetratricopeptide (TPR) repeat protein
MFDRSNLDVSSLSFILYKKKPCNKMVKVFRFSLFLFLCLLNTSTVWGQINFRASWAASNPVPPESTLTIEDKMKAHRYFLDQATHEKDRLKQLYGWLYLFHDYLNVHDYTAAAQYLLEAESIANTSGNIGWQGWVTHRKGVLFFLLQNYEAAIEPYEAAAKLCGEAGDSLCLGESLEQLGACYSQINDFAQARRYFEAAVPIIQKYGTETTLGVSLNNYGGLLCQQNLPNEAIPCLQQAIGIWQKLGRRNDESSALNSLGVAYEQLDRFEESVKIFDRCIDINTELNRPENLIVNYSCLANLYERKGELAKAIIFLKKSFDLRDSIIGVKTQLEIADLQAKYSVQQKELELQKSQNDLTTARLQLERGIVFFIFLLLLLAFAFWRWRVQIRQSKRERVQNQENLNDLTRILLDKNALLLDLEKQVLELMSHDDRSAVAKDFEGDLYNQRILTDSDWAAFKAYFEKAYPGYLFRLRTVFPALSDAEERLFLFIKLHLTNKESAVMLGISDASIKKTRNRLRKRLGLDEEITLEAYISDF